jgi:hypothetical protein
MAGKVENVMQKLEEQWMRIHGVNPLDPVQQWITTAALGGKVVTSAALTGAEGTAQVEEKVVKALGVAGNSRA